MLLNPRAHESLLHGVELFQMAHFNIIGHAFDQCAVFHGHKADHPSLDLDHLSTEVLGEIDNSEAFERCLRLWENRDVEAFVLVPNAGVENDSLRFRAASDVVHSLGPDRADSESDGHQPLFYKILLNICEKFRGGDHRCRCDLRTICACTKCGCHKYERDRHSTVPQTESGGFEEMFQRTRGPNTGLSGVTRIIAG